MSQPIMTKEIDEFYRAIEEERGNIMSETKKGSTFIKHFYSKTFEDEPHYTAEITVDEDANLTEMCRAFELFLKVSGYELGDKVVKIEKEDVTFTIDTSNAYQPDLQSTFDVKM